MNTVFLLKDPIFHPKALLLRFGLPLVIVLGTWWATKPSQQFGAGGGQDADGLPGLVFVIVVFLLSTADSLGQARTRVFDFQLPLPISTREFVGLRLVAHLLPGLVLFTALFLCLLSQASSLVGSLVSFAALFSAWTCFSLSLFVWKPELPRISSPWAYAASIVFGICALAFASLFPGPALLFNILVGFGLVNYLWGRVPETMFLMDDELHEEPQLAQRAGKNDSDKIDSFNRWLAGQIASQPWFYGFALGLFFYSVFYPWGGHGLLVSATMVMFFTILLQQSSAGILSDFGHLPIPRRTFAAWILLPSALIVSVGTCAGHLLQPRFLSESNHRVSLSFDQPEEEALQPQENWNLRVPSELLHLQWGQEPVLVTAPEGETVTIHPLSPYKLLPFGVVNLYEVDPLNSAEFIAWRLSQAIQDSYGFHIAPEDLRRDYMHWKRFDHYQFARDHPDLKSISAPQGRLALGLGSNLLAWVVALFAFTAKVPPNRARWISRTVLKSVLAVPFVLLLVSSIPPDPNEERILTQFRKAVEFNLDLWINTSPSLAAGISLLVLAATYCFAVRRIERMEVPTPNPFLRARQLAKRGK